MAENKSSISGADSYEKIGAFWDEHDFTDYDDPTRPDVDFTIRETVRIEAGLLTSLRKVAAEKGVSTETLVNLWLMEKLHAGGR